MGVIWAPIMYLAIITFPGVFQFYLGVPHFRIYSYRILPIWDLYGSYMSKIRLYGAHVGPELDKCPESAIRVLYIHVSWEKHLINVRLQSKLPGCEKEVYLSRLLVATRARARLESTNKKSVSCMYLLYHIQWSCCCKYLTLYFWETTN